MDKPTKYLFIGIAIAALICVGGYLRSVYEYHHLTSLVEKCKTESSQAQKGTIANWQKAPMVCDPVILAELGVNDCNGIQKEIVRAQQNAGRFSNHAVIIAGIVIVFFATPYAWYFLLRRIRELRNAIVGQ